MSKTSLGQVSWLRVFCSACLKTTGRFEALQTGAAGMGDGGWEMGVLAASVPLSILQQRAGAI